MGIGRPWIDVAEAVGFEAFVTVWRVLASSEAVLDERNRVCVPAFSNFLRYQRNQLIRGLFDAGFTVPDIRAEVERAGRESPSEKQIRRIINRT